MNENHKQVLAFLQSQETKLNYIYTDLSRKLASLLKRYNINSSSNVWHRNLGLQKEVDALFKEFQPQLLQHFSDEITKAWGMADTQNDNFVRAYLGKTVISDAERAVMFGRNAKALEAFLTKRQRNFTLSERVWDLTKQTKSQIEYFLKEGLTDGRSATKLAGDLQSFLKEPERRFRRIKDKKTGKLKISEPGKDYHPGRGVYRSSYKNALRLARNEVNIAYRTADNIRREKLDFVVGTEVHLSNAHPTYDICDELVGKYPKGFNFTGWHVNCYDKETEVYTNNGWVFFKDVKKGDKALSLNSEKNLEWSNVDFTIEKHHKGPMIHFENKYLDLLVTEDHPMVYIPKSKTDLIYSNKKAKDFRKTHGAFYRSSEYVAQQVQNIKIGSILIDFNLFCEFMGYYLADGSISRKHAVIISQRKDHDTENYKSIDFMLSRLGIDYHAKKEGFNIYNKDLWEYLETFGKCNEKYIPEEIKNSGPSQISIFLDAFVSCDGYISKNKPFIGSRGTLCVPKNNSRHFYTTSKRMADDIGELILKIGKRPSFKEKKSKGVVQEFKNGNYKANFNLWTISECHSKTSTVFDKKEVQYDDMIYDVQLDRNHIILVRRNGKVVWGSNCLCYSTSVLLPISDFKKYQKGDLNPNTKAVKTIPKRASKYIDNMPKEKVSKLQFVDENKKYFKKSERKSKLKKNVEVKKEVDVQTFIPAKSMEEVKDRFKNIGFKRVEINGTTLEQANIYLNGIESEFIGLNKKPEINMLEIFRNKNEKYQGQYSFTSNIMRFNTEYAFYGRELGDVVGFQERIKVLEEARKGRIKSIEFYEGQKNKKRWRSDINSNKDMLWKIDYEIKSLKDKIKKGEVEKVFIYSDSFDNKADKIKALVHHEFGHYWDDVFSNKNKINKNDLLAISEYAKSNTEEYIAEMYSKYRMTNSLEGMPDDLVDFFNKINR